MNWWETEPSGTDDGVSKPRAVASYRHSAQDRQENSIPIQRDQVHEWADKNGVEIIHEFADAGKSGLNAEGRPAFTATPWPRNPIASTHPSVPVLVP